MSELLTFCLPPYFSNVYGTTHIIFQHREPHEVECNAIVPLVKARVATYQTETRFYTQTSGLSLKDRQRSRCLVGVDVTPHMPAYLSDPVDQLNILWNICQLFSTHLMEGLPSSMEVPI